MAGTAEYLAELKDQGKDPIALQRGTPRVIAGLIEGVTDHDLRRRPAPGKWSVAEIIAHLAEDEISSAWRYRQMIENPGVQLPGFDQDEWARLGNYASRDVRESLELFRLLREANVAMFARLSDDEWQRNGVHGERGPMTVRSLAEHMAGHDLNHMEQIRRILRK